MRNTKGNICTPTVYRVLFSLTRLYTNVHERTRVQEYLHGLDSTRVHAYTHQITGKWSEQQISLIYFNFSPATRARLLVWILCAPVNYCEVIFEFVLIYERLLGAS